MSNRTLVELNHDYCPNLDNEEALLKWGEAIALYMKSGMSDYLPQGVEFKHIRHHTDPDPVLINSSPADEGHNEPCFYCGEPCNYLSPTPSMWPVQFFHKDGTGIIRTHHMKCIVSKLGDDMVDSINRLTL